jgi:cell division protein FtsB
MKKKKSSFQLTKKIKGFLFLFGLVTIVALKMYLMFQVDLLMKDRRLLGRQYEKISGQTERLQAEVDRLGNIDRITRIARKEYKMVNNSDENLAVKILDKDRLSSYKEDFADKEKKSTKLNLAGVQ